MPMDAYALIILAFILGTLVGIVIATLFADGRAERAESENARLKAQIIPFDRDGDGRIGGSKKRAF